MARRQYSGSGAANALTALQDAGQPQFDFDQLVKNVTGLQKMRDDAKKTEDDYQEKLADLDLKAQYYGIGRASANSNRNIAITPYAQMNMQAPQLPPIAAGQAAYAGMPIAPGSTQPTALPDPIANLPPIVRNRAMASVAVAQAKAGIADKELSGKELSGKELSGKELSGEQLDAVASQLNALNSLEGITSRQEKAKYPTGPVLAGGDYGFSDMPFAATRRAKSFDPDEADFFAAARGAFADYVKAQTGAQRGFKELAFLEPAQPSLSGHTPEQFVRVGKGSIERSRMKLNNVLDLTERAGYKNIDKLFQKVGRAFTDEASASEAIQTGKLRKGDIFFVNGSKAKVD